MNFDIRVTARSFRKETIDNARSASESTETFFCFRNRPTELKIISVGISLPVYRMANCRTYSEQQNAIVTKELGEDFFSKGQESAAAQSRQHEILRKITKKARSSIANIDEVLAEDGQRESLIITSTGVVVNGNRRLSAMRELYASDPVRFKAFSHVNCAVLPADATPDDIDDVEAALQAMPETKLDYDWVSEAQLVRRQKNKGKTIAEVAHQLRRNVPDIKNILQALEEADLYLSEWARKPRQYTIVVDEEQLFKDIPKCIGSHNLQLKTASRAIAWSIFENPDRFSGRIYNYNAAFGRLATEVARKVTERLDIELTTADDADGVEYEIDLEEDEKIPDYGPFVEALRDDDIKEEAIEVLSEACIAAIEKDTGERRRDAAFKSLVQVHSRLAAINISTASGETYKKMLKQIESIDARLKKLEEEINEALAGEQQPEGESGGNATQSRS